MLALTAVSTVLLASVAPRTGAPLDPLSLLGDSKAAQKTKLNAYAPLPGCEMATLAMS